MSLSTQYSTGNYLGRIAVIKSQSIVEIRFSSQDSRFAKEIFVVGIDSEKRRINSA